MVYVIRKYQAWSLSCLEQGADERGRWAHGLNIPVWSPDPPAWQAECLFHLSEPCWSESAESWRDVNSWSMITQHVNPFLLLPIKTFQLLLQRIHVSLHLRQQPLGWVENRTLQGITCLAAAHLSHGHHFHRRVTACVPSWWGFLLPQLSFMVTSRVLEVAAFLGSHQLCWPSDTQGFIWGAPCPSPLRQLSQGYRTQHLIALEGGMILSPSRFESLRVWIGDWIKFCTFFWSC